MAELESGIEKRQKSHYDRIAAEYTAHYGDKYSAAYRQRFYYPAMFGGINLQNANVLEAMCGGGETTEFLLQMGATVTGLDISEAQLAGFSRRWPQCSAVCASILQTNLPAESFDCVAVAGGLHHVQPHAAAAVAEIARILKPGGAFCFVEPHKHSLPDSIRRFWYRCDPLFESNEAAVDLKQLQAKFNSDFIFETEYYGGSLAYLFVQNSMIFRIPPRLKGLYSGQLIAIESLLNRLQGPRLSCFVAGRWKKQ